MNEVRKVGRVESLDLETRLTLLFFLFFLSLSPLTLSSPPPTPSSFVSFLSQFANSPPRTKVSQKKHLSSISVSTQTSHLFLCPFIGRALWNPLFPRVYRRRPINSKRKERKTTGGEGLYRNSPRSI